MIRAFFLTFTWLLFGTSFAQNGNWKLKTEQPEFLHRTIKEITDVMVHDIYSPPVASRTYAYVSVAAYEALVQGNDHYQSFAGQLHGLQTIPKPDAGITYSPTLAAVQAVLSTGKAMIISEEKIDTFSINILKEFRGSGMPSDVYENSLAYGKKIAAHILQWASTDNYKQTRSFPKYAVSEDDGTWKPTPPSYMKAVEPHWSKIRTFLIDSAQQFKPLPALPFSKDSNSAFFREAMAVHDIRLKLTPEQIEIANFWDCNPFKMNINGHVMYATKKISPGGHWMNITGLVCRKKQADCLQTAEAYACVSIAIADCFISCWDEKYRSRVIRPETYINQYIDDGWMPLLQTPPFPEYTSGHSVVSMAAAKLLTKMFGDHFSYTDSTEMDFGIPVRKFDSFEQAAKEAAISRFYGGIHYMPSINNGMKEGESLGTYVLQHLHTRNESVADVPTKDSGTGGKSFR